MSCPRDFGERVRELTAARFQEFERDVVRAADRTPAHAETEKRRDKNRRDFMTSLGIEPRKLDAAVEEDNRRQDAELKTFLADHRAKAIDRPQSPSFAQEMASHAAVLAGSGCQILPVFASSLFAADKASFDDIAGMAPADWTDGAINSGWVWPTDPSRIRIKDNEHDLSLCWPNDYVPAPEFAAHFAFTPATDGTYDMTAITAFHGFYILVADDSWYNCRFARVKLTVQTRVHQYVNTPWKNFPALLDIEKQNTNEITLYDHVAFSDHSAVLRAGDPVIFTLKGRVEAFSHGGGTHAELNFASGQANFIEPLFLSVSKR